MKMNIRSFKYTLPALALVSVFTACEPEIDRDFPDYDELRGDADFTSYVALGNSLTAGMMDDQLNRFGQINSYPAIIADKIAAVMPGFEFRQPLLPEGLVDGTLQLRNLVPGSPPTPDIRASSGGLSMNDIAADKISGIHHNLGIPGAKVADLTNPSYSNIYFQRFLSSEGNSLVDEALRANPTFFTLWIGNNDVLGFAAGGGRYSIGNGELRGEAITPVQEFTASYEDIISSLKDGNPEIEGAIANIPNVANIAFFNVVPWNAFGLTAEQASLINAGLKAEIEGPVRQAVIMGVVTEGARRQVISAVAPAVVWEQTVISLKAGGMEDSEARQQADAFVQTEEGQEEIGGLAASLIEFREPAQVHVLVEQQLQSEEVTANVNTMYEAATEADQDPERDISEVIGPEGSASVTSNFNTQLALLKAGKYYPTLQAGPNGFIVQSETSPTGIIQLNEQAKMLLTFLGRSDEEFNPAENRIIVPDYYALDQEEVMQVNAAVNGYNAAITQIANENTLALVDVNSFLSQISTGGISEDGINFTSNFITGNTFSLDGVHLTQRGYALVAKKFIETINSYYKSSLPVPHVNQYPAVALPAN